MREETFLLCSVQAKRHTKVRTKRLETGWHSIVGTASVSHLPPVWNPRNLRRHRAKEDLRQTQQFEEIEVEEMIEYKSKGECITAVKSGGVHAVVRQKCRMVGF